MRLFKEGDKLELQHDYCGFDKGTVVEVIRVDSGDEMLPYLCENGSLVFWYPENILKLVKQSHDGKIAEVYRAAKPGEYIKITAPTMTSGCYERGNILKVFERHNFGVYAFTKKQHPDHSHDTDKPTSWIADDEYVVLKDYVPKNADSPKECSEVKRHAKAGERIKIVAPYFPTGYSVGSILKVKESKYFHNEGRNDGVWAWSGGTEVTVNDSEYVVLEGYKPPELKSIPSKRSYTAAEIAKAKELCGKMMVEAFDDGNTFSLRFVDKNYSANSEEVQCELSRFNCAPGSSGIATCSDHDEYNVWIGRCVALCKALHKPVPGFIMGENGNHSRHFDYEKAKRLTICPDFDAVIHVKNEDERAELMEEFEKLGFHWFSGSNPKEYAPLHPFDGCFGVHYENFGYNAPDNCKKYVEFSDCFTED